MSTANIEGKAGVSLTGGVAGWEKASGNEDSWADAIQLLKLAKFLGDTSATPSGTCYEH